MIRLFQHFEKSVFPRLFLPNSAFISPILSNFSKIPDLCGFSWFFAFFLTSEIFRNLIFRGAYFFSLALQKKSSFQIPIFLVVSTGKKIRSLGGILYIHPPMKEKHSAKDNNLFFEAFRKYCQIILMQRFTSPSYN